jgi:NAD(P)-dependent dehydrogenase (short-subunit alcohol dehydrogenase family)
MSEEKRGPVILVVGAAGGIGQALSRRLAERGARLVLAGRDMEKLEALAVEIGGAPRVIDARDVASMQAAVDATVADHGRIDGAVNLAGSILLKPAHLTTPEEWAETMATNLTTAFALVRAAAPAMSRNGGGSIVLMSSAAARIGLVNHEAIAAAKAGVIGLMLASAATYAPRNVRINAVALGLVKTPLSARLTANEASRKVSEAMHALGRLGEPDEVASLIAWLLLDANWVTGQTFGIDGGLGTVRAR